MPVVGARMPVEAVPGTVVVGEPIPGSAVPGDVVNGEPRFVVAPGEVALPIPGAGSPKFVETLGALGEPGAFAFGGPACTPPPGAAVCAAAAVAINHAVTTRPTRTRAFVTA